MFYSDPIAERSCFNISNLVDLWSETQASFIGDDAQPALTITNSSTGAGLQVDRLVVTSTATIAGGVSFAGTLNSVLTITSNTTLAIPLSLVRTVIGAPSVALQTYQVSGASVPVFEFKNNALVSAVSIVFAASGNWAGLSVVRVKFSDGTTYGWIPVLPSATVTAAAI